MTELFALQPSSGIPIYRQIVDQLRALIASGSLVPGAKLPSVRSIATSLGINPMTVSKAYSLLEREGVVVRQPGTGMVVSNEVASAADVLQPELRALVIRAQELGMSHAELIVELTKIWEETP